MTITRKNGFAGTANVAQDSIEYGHRVNLFRRGILRHELEHRILQSPTINKLSYEENTFEEYLAFSAMFDVCETCEEVNKMFNFLTILWKKSHRNGDFHRDALEKILGVRN